MVGCSFQNDKAQHQIFKAIEIQKAYLAALREIKNKRHHKSILSKGDKSDSSGH